MELRCGLVIKERSLKKIIKSSRIGQLQLSPERPKMQKAAGYWLQICKVYNKYVRADNYLRRGKNQVPHSRDEFEFLFLFFFSRHLISNDQRSVYFLKR